MSMSKRLRQARILAGYKTASEAITKFGWNNSAYRAHENGQNSYSIVSANNYAKAYGTTSAWLMLGHRGNGIIEYPSRNEHIESDISAKEWVLEKIYALAVLLRDNASNSDLIIDLIDNAQSYMKLVSKEKLSSSPNCQKYKHNGRGISEI